MPRLHRIVGPKDPHPEGTGHNSVKRPFVRWPFASPSPVRLRRGLSKGRMRENDDVGHGSAFSSNPRQTSWCDLCALRSTPTGGAQCRCAVCWSQRAARRRRENGTRRNCGERRDGEGGRGGEEGGARPSAISGSINPSSSPRPVRVGWDHVLIVAGQTHDAIRNRWHYSWGMRQMTQTLVKSRNTGEQRQPSWVGICVYPEARHSHLKPLFRSLHMWTAYCVALATNGSSTTFDG